jgi:dynein heavy chain
MMTVPPFKITQGGKFTDLIIPTVDSIRNNYLLTLYINMKTHMLLTGPTGTGKTVNVINEISIFFILDNNYLNETFTNLITAFSG